MKLLNPITVVVMLACSSCYMVHKNGETRLGPGNHAGFIAAACATAVGGSIRIAAAYGEVDNVHEIRSAEFLLLGGILTGLITTYVSLAYLDVPETEAKLVKVVPLDSLLEHRQAKPKKDVSQGAEAPPPVKDAPEQADAPPPAEEKRPPPVEEPAAPAVLVDCPEGTSVEGAAPPAGFEQFCVDDGGVREGPYRSWYGVDKNASAGRYRKGERDGTWRFWHGTGALRLSAEYRLGKKVGTWVWYDKDGKQTKTETL